jgi:hypothetical protein
MMPCCKEKEKKGGWSGHWFLNIKLKRKKQKQKQNLYGLMLEGIPFMELFKFHLNLVR